MTPEMSFNPFSINVFRHFYHFQKIGCNSANFGHENANYISNERFYLLNDLIFEIIFEKVEKTSLKIPFFEGVWKSTHPWYLKG